MKKKIEVNVCLKNVWPSPLIGLVHLSRTTNALVNKYGLNRYFRKIPNWYHKNIPKYVFNYWSLKNTFSVLIKMYYLNKIC